MLANQITGPNPVELAQARKALSLLKSQHARGETAAQRIASRQSAKPVNNSDRPIKPANSNGNYRKLFNPDEPIVTKNTSKKIIPNENLEDGPIIPSKHFDQPFDENPTKPPLNSVSNTTTNMPTKSKKPQSMKNITANKDERPIKPATELPKVEEHPKNEEQTEPIPCEYCDRKFNPISLEKHKKVCEMRPGKPKRKAFDSSKTRTTDPEQVQLAAEGQKEEKKPVKKMAKWKAQSSNFRKAIGKLNEESDGGMGKKTEIKEDEQEEPNDFVKCPTCGRSFNQEAAKKHLPFCANRQKLEQMKNPKKANSANPLTSKKK